MYLQTKLQVADQCGLVFANEYEDGEPVFIGSDKQFKMYQEAIERETNI